MARGCRQIPRPPVEFRPLCNCQACRDGPWCSKSCSPTAPQLVVHRSFDFPYYSTRTGADALNVMNLDGTGTTLLVNDVGLDVIPRWSPDGEEISYSSDRDGNRDVFAVRAQDGVSRRITSHVDLVHGSELRTVLRAAPSVPFSVPTQPHRPELRATQPNSAVF